MKVSSSSLLPLFRSDVQGRLLAVLLANSKDEFSVGDLAKRVGTSLPTALREVSRLSEAGIITSRQLGNLRLSKANQDHHLFPEISKIVLYTFGPKELLSKAFEDLPGLTEGYIFGSWAARYLGNPGEDPGDIDVLLVGKFSRAKAFDIAIEVGQKIGKEVNVNNLSEEDWKEGESGFLRTIRSRPLVQIVGEPDDQGPRGTPSRKPIRTR